MNHKSCFGNDDDFIFILMLHSQNTVNNNGIVFLDKVWTTLSLVGTIINQGVLEFESL